MAVRSSSAANVDAGLWPHPGGHRPQGWLVLAALGAVFALSTGDRAILPVLKTTLSEELRVSNPQYAQLVTIFLTAYTLTYLGVGSVIRAFGVRNALTTALFGMTCSMILSGTSRGVTQLGLALILLGLAQACVVPAVTLTIFNRFGATRHARAYAVVNAIQSSAGIACPSIIAIISLHLGWRWCFFLPAIAAAIVIPLWWRVASLLDPVSNKIVPPPAVFVGGWREAVFSRPVLILLIARAISDPFWFFFQYWQVAFFRERIHMTMTTVGHWAWVPPLVATVVAFGFATFSDGMIGRGYSVVRSRILPILLSTLLGISVFLLPRADSVGTAIALSSLAMAMGNTWLSLTAILMGSLVPRPILASVLGLMSAVGGTSAIVLNSFAGGLIDRFGYAAPLWIGATLYPLAAVLLASQFLWKNGPAPARPSP